MRTLISSIFAICVVTTGWTQDADKQGVMDFLDSQAAEPEVQKSRETLASEYAFQFRQDMQNRLSRLSQNSVAGTRDTDQLGAPMRSTLREEEKREADELSTPDQLAAQQAKENFGQAVRGLDIRAINPGRKEFLSGADNVFEGDIMDISSGSGIYRVWIVAIKDTGITFMDYRSRQTETLPLQLDAPSVPTRPWGAAGGSQDAPPF